jgi:hypothetical protein
MKGEFSRFRNPKKIKKNQIEALEMRSFLSQIKNSFESLSSRLH